MPQICIVPRVEGIGGVASFRLKMEAGLAARGIRVVNDADDPQNDAVLVLAGTRRVDALIRAQHRGIPVVQRLDGINWVHRKRRTGLRHYLRAEYGNLLLALIRSRLATKIIYQSEFSRRWWEDWHGKLRIPHEVVHNGVDLETYAPVDENALRSAPPYRLLLVEGSLGSGYDMGLDNAVLLAETIQTKYGFPMVLVVVGKVTDEHKRRVDLRARVKIQWMGSVPRERIPEIDRTAHLLFSADLNAACPNSVIEALACGLPVVGFDTGALNELIRGDAGRLVAYGGDPWRIEPPDVPALAAAAVEILHDQPGFRRAARQHAETALGLDAMVEKYLNALLG